MKRKIVFALVFIIGMFAVIADGCSLGFFNDQKTQGLPEMPVEQNVDSGDVPQTQEIEPPVLSDEPGNTVTTVSFGGVTLAIPTTIADGASGSEMPAVDGEDVPMFQKVPAHWQVMLGDYYALKGTFHQPQIYIYPAQEYAEMVPMAFENIHRINNLVSNHSAVNGAELPSVPFFNAQRIFASNVEVVSFQNGIGVRFLTQYAQYTAPVNNHELFYHFQGLTDDGAYYIIAIFPVTDQMLAETGDPAAVVPPGGVTYPDFNDVNADWQGYYAAVANLLNTTSVDDFTPSLSQLDALINSMLIATP